MSENQNPEQQARDRIDAQLRAAGWAVQKKIDFSAGIGQAVREWTTDAGPADYVLFVDKKAFGVIEAKRESEGQHLTVHETQTAGDRSASVRFGKSKMGKSLSDRFGVVKPGGLSTHQSRLP